MSTAHPAVDTAGLDRNRELVRRWFDEGMTQPDVASARAVSDEIFAGGFVDHDGTGGDPRSRGLAARGPRQCFRRLLRHRGAHRAPVRAGRFRRGPLRVPRAAHGPVHGSACDGGASGTPRMRSSVSAVASARAGAKGTGSAHCTSSTPQRQSRRVRAAFVDTRWRYRWRRDDCAPHTASLIRRAASRTARTQPLPASRQANRLLAVGGRARVAPGVQDRPREGPTAQRP